MFVLYRFWNDARASLVDAGLWSNVFRVKGVMDYLHGPFRTGKRLNEFLDILRNLPSASSARVLMQKFLGDTWVAQACGSGEASVEDLVAEARRLLGGHVPKVCMRRWFEWVDAAGRLCGMWNLVRMLANVGDLVLSESGKAWREIVIGILDDDCELMDCRLSTSLLGPLRAEYSRVAELACAEGASSRYEIKRATFFWLRRSVAETIAVLSDPSFLDPLEFTTHVAYGPTALERCALESRALAAMQFVISLARRRFVTQEPWYPRLFSGFWTLKRRQTPWQQSRWTGIVLCTSNSTEGCPSGASSTTPRKSSPGRHSPGRLFWFSRRRDPG